MLPLSYRLPTREFTSVLKRGKRITSDSRNLMLVYQDSGNHKPRFGFVISAKVSPKAVARNRIKRLMREVVRHAVDKATIGYDYVFIARSGIQELTQKKVENSIISLLERAKPLLNGES